MNTANRLVKNRTGVATNPDQAAAMQQGSATTAPTSTGSTQAAGKVRVLYAKQGEELGSIPPVANMKEKIKSMVGLGARPEILDKLGERLAFERTGTRLYEALISKHEAYGGFAGGPEREELAAILNEEHRHFVLLERAIRDAGGDPTAVTPSADIAATASQGVQKVITDPRTTLQQSLEAILIAELTDRDSWEMLVDLCSKYGLTDLAAEFTAAQRTEEEHLSKVRGWLRAAAS